MIQPSRVVFGAMEEVLFGSSAAEALAKLARRFDARRVFLMVSGTLNRDTALEAEPRLGRVVVAAGGAAHWRAGPMPGSARQD